MPVFRHHKNLRSPKEAPSFATSDSWQVREDRLSTPLTGIYNGKSGDYYTVIRLDKFENESLSAHNAGEIILTNKTSLGFTGFRNVNGTSALVFGFPYSEAPKTYIRKLTLAPAVQAFEKLEKDETRHLVWEIKKGKAQDDSGFITNTWAYSFDMYKPQPIKLSKNLFFIHISFDSFSSLFSLIKMLFRIFRYEIYHRKRQEPNRIFPFRTSHKPR